MTLFAAIGKAQGLDATEAAILATDQALAQTGRHEISLAIIASAHDYPVDQVVNGVAGLLSDTPLLGFSTPAQLTAEGIHHRSIVVALIVGDQLQADSGWWEEHNDNGHSDDLQFLKMNDPEIRGLLVAADSLDSKSLGRLHSTSIGSFSLGGCLAGGEISADDTYQIGGRSYGSKGIAAAALRGRVSLGMGARHGWQPLGIYLRITQTDDLLIKTLDGRRACEAYAEVFGYPARDWTYPPLNHLVRLYPFGVEIENNGKPGSTNLHIRAPRRVEVDGSLRMDSRIAQGKTAHLMVSSIDNCLAAARNATELAVHSLGGAKPVLALVFADIAWQMQLQAQPGAEVSAIQEVIGEGVPIIGGYTFGQLISTPDGEPDVLNQHIQVILIGDPEEKPDQFPD
jgi:hypothetical protein